MNDVTKFAYHIFEELRQRTRPGKVWLADVYESLCAKHRLPKPVIRNTLIELSQADMIELVFHAPEPYIKLKDRVDCDDRERDS